MINPVAFQLANANITNTAYKLYVRIEGQRVWKSNVLLPSGKLTNIEKQYIKQASLRVVGCGVVGSTIEIVGLTLASRRPRRALPPLLPAAPSDHSQRQQQH